MDEREELRARNEALLRSVNDQMAALDASSAGWADAQQVFDFKCECGSTVCGEVVQMSLAEYEKVRSQRDRFAVAPGHQSPELENVAEKNERFYIVDKRDRVEPLVE